MKIGVIGGSGLYEIESLENAQTVEVETPFGAPSDSFVTGTVAGTEVAFLARHARGHRLLPSELNHRANIFAMKKLGVDRLISVSAVGSLREELVPGDLVLIDQYVDRTKRGGGEHTFFGEGIVAHIGFSDPICADLAERIRPEAEAVLAEKPARALADRAPTVHAGGTYVNMEGPAFSTRAESLLYRSWGMDVIGMTSLAEAKLAREAEMCLSVMAFVTDFDCWHDVHEAVSAQMVFEVLMQNAETAKEILTRAIPAAAQATGEECGCRTALDTALLTPRDAMPEKTQKKLAPIVRRAFSG